MAGDEKSNEMLSKKVALIQHHFHGHLELNLSRLSQKDMFEIGHLSPTFKAQVDMKLVLLQCSAP